MKTAARACVALATLAAAFVAVSATMEVDLSQVTEWEATPLIVDEARFAEGGKKCGAGVCTFANGVCCEKSGSCCEWGNCVESNGGATCEATKEQNALLLAKAFAKDEARKEVNHEQAKKSKSEQGVKLMAEAKQKNVQEAGEKKQATVEEAQAKRIATTKHQAKLAASESKEEKGKVRESRAKRKAQKAMVNRFRNSRAVTFASGRSFDVKANKCYSNTLRSKHFSVSFWLYNRGGAKGTRQIMSAGPLRIWSQEYRGHSRIGVTLSGSRRHNFRLRHSFPVHKWVHITAVVRGARFELYRSGRRISRRSLGRGWKVSGLNKRHKVCAATGAVMPARIGDIRFFNKAVKSSEVSAIVKEKRHDKVAGSSTVTTLIDGSWSPKTNKVINRNSMRHSGAYSMGMWLRLTGMASVTSNIIHKGDSNGGPSTFLDLKAVNNGVLSIRSGRDPRVEIPVPSDKWFHFAWTHGSNKVTVYVDGKVVKTQSVANAPSIPNKPLYASNPWGRETPAAPVLAANLVFAPRVLDVTGIRAAMAKAYDHNWMPAGKLVLKHHDLAKGSVTLPPTSMEPTTCRTVAFWLKPRGGGAGWRSVFHKGQSTSERSPAVWFRPGTTALHIRSGTRANSNYGVDPKEALPVNVWSHVAVVHCLRNMSVYVNGQLKGQDKNAAAPITNDGSLYVYKKNYQPANTEIAGLRYWQFALNAKMVHRVTENAEHP